jgi:hypothetical protein
MKVELEKKGSNINIFFNFLEKNKKYIIIFVVLIIITLGSLLFFKEINKRENTKISEEFNQAKIFLNNNNNEKAKNILKSLIEKNNKFYSISSLYLLIDNKLENDDQVIIYFDQLINLNKIKDDKKDLLRLKKAFYLLNNDLILNQKEKILLETLNPIIKNKNSIWKKSSLRLLRDFFDNKGEKIKSKEFNDLLNQIK